MNWVAGEPVAGDRLGSRTCKFSRIHEPVLSTFVNEFDILCLCGKGMTPLLDPNPGERVLLVSPLDRIRRDDYPFCVFCGLGEWGLTQRNSSPIF